MAGRGEGSITRYRDISLRALATANVDQARAFVACELGALAARDDTTRRLAATVRTYLDENGSRARTAKRLNVHENTVSYRLRQAEEIWEGQWTSAPSNCVSHSPWPISSARRLNRIDEIQATFRHTWR